MQIVFDFLFVVDNRGDASAQRRDRMLITPAAALLSPGRQQMVWGRAVMHACNQSICNACIIKNFNMYTFMHYILIT